MAAHVQYKQNYLACIGQIRGAQTRGDFKVEEHGVELIGNQQMSVFRRRATTLGESQRAVLNLGG